MAIPDACLESLAWSRRSSFPAGAKSDGVQPCLVLDHQQLLQDVLGRVPAYRQFLDKAGASPGGPWTSLPLTNKADYLLAYPFEDLVWDRDLSGCHFIGCSSGFSKTGSIFWPKRPEDERNYLEGLRQTLADHYAIDQKRTLVLVCLAFGTWIAGIQMAASMRAMAIDRGELPITVCTPGLNLSEAVQICARFQGQFEQFLWITNPSNIPLIATLLQRHELPVGGGRHQFAVLGEYYSQDFRDWVARRFEQQNPYGIWTGYGSADTGGIGVETAATIALRAWYAAHPEQCQDRFGTASVPMILAQSSDILVEVVDGELIVSKDQLVPLIRYNTRDAGGQLNKSDCPEIDGLPELMVYVYGRASDAVIFYGTNLMMSDLADFFLGLEADYRYGGLFEVRKKEREGVSIFMFSLYAFAPDEQLRERLEAALMRFLTGRSLEFAAKFEPLSRSFGEKLIQLDLKDAAELQGRIKHRYLLEA
jgi:phenylacetate-CoA ligase